MRLLTILFNNLTYLWIVKRKCIPQVGNFNNLFTKHFTTDNLANVNEYNSSHYITHPPSSLTLYQLCCHWRVSEDWSVSAGVVLRPGGKKKECREIRCSHRYQRLRSCYRRICQSQTHENDNYLTAGCCSSSTSCCQKTGHVLRRV